MFESRALKFSLRALQNSCCFNLIGLSSPTCVSDGFLLTKAGFSMGVIKQIEKAGYSIDDIVGVVAEHKGLKAAEIKKWLLVDTGYAKWTWANQIAEWQKCGFSSEEAAEWFREGFKAKDAKAWVESGAMTPAIAKRRKAAGISPKTLS
jgi:hypothetical protein